MIVYYNIYCNADRHIFVRSLRSIPWFFNKPSKNFDAVPFAPNHGPLFPILLLCRDSSYLCVADGGWRCTACMYLFCLRVSWRPVVRRWSPAKSRGPGWGLVRPFGLPLRYPLFMHRRFRRYELHIVTNSNAHNVIAV